MEALERRRHRVELLATILLAMAAVATAWSTYQSTQWRGQQAADNSKASAARIESSEASTRAGQLTQVDIATFTQWVDAYVAGNTGAGGLLPEALPRRSSSPPSKCGWRPTR